MKATAACGRSEGHVEFRGLMNGTTAILIDVETAWTLLTTLTHGDSVEQEKHDLACLKDNAFVDAMGMPTRRRILDKCILALTSPEPRQRRRRACTPVTRTGMLTTRRNWGSR